MPKKPGRQNIRRTPSAKIQEILKAEGNDLAVPSGQGKEQVDENVKNVNVVDVCRSLAAGAVHAQNYPTKPVRLIIRSHLAALQISWSASSRPA